MQSNRLFEIIYILMNKKSITAGDLAERFGVSRRTIYRDIDTLSLAGIPVYTEKGKGGGINLLPDFVLNKSLLSEKEQTEILSALQGLSSVRGQEADDILNKLSTVFNKNAVNWLEVDFSGWSYSDGKAFQDFKNAILEKRIAEFDYYSSFGEKTQRCIEPVQLWFKSKAWYIRGFCLARQDIRLFKLSRVKNLRITQNHFEERDLLASVLRTESPGTQKRDVELKLKVDAKMTYRVYDEFDEDCFERQPDGSFIISVTWPEDDWVYGTILSYGEHAEVLEPPHIREVIREKAQRAAEKYL